MKKLPSTNVILSIMLQKKLNVFGLSTAWTFTLLTADAVIESQKMASS